MGVSANPLTATPPHESQGASAFHPSLRSKMCEVTDGRFEPMTFNANCQTDRELIDRWLNKERIDTEVETEPVQIRLPPELNFEMVQTDPMINEPVGVEEHIPATQPPDCSCRKFIVLNLPENEAFPSFKLPSM